MVFGYFGQIFYIGLLLTNAVAILSEDRFLAKSEHRVPELAFVLLAAGCDPVIAGDMC